MRAYSRTLGFEIGAHALGTAATNALDHQADIAKVQEWLGHANIATTRIYDHRRTRPRTARRSRSIIEPRKGRSTRNALSCQFEYGPKTPQRAGLSGAAGPRARAPYRRLMVRRGNEMDVVGASANRQKTATSPAYG